MIAQALGELLTAYGAYLIATRLAPLRKSAAVTSKNAPALPTPRVSIIVPARNEAANIGRLVDSLRDLDYPAREIIVVDDESQDATGEIARTHGAQVVSAGARPDGWRGKQWAAWQGAQVAQGEYLLFTDADTVHTTMSLTDAMSDLQKENADLLTALPYHRCESWWECLCGPFHVVLLSITRPFARPRPGRLFAIGQYLLFRRGAYDAIKGHASVRDTWVEDLPIAHRILEQGLKLSVCKRQGLYSVRMYPTLREFMAGWRRNFRAGFRYGSAIQSFEVAVLFMTFIKLYSGDPLAMLFALAATLSLAIRQRSLGGFSWLGALFPLPALFLFASISLAAAWDTVWRRPLVWKTRSYGPTG